MIDVSFYIWPGMPDLPSISPYCIKVILAAKARDLTYDVHHVMRMPKWVTTGKLPAAMIGHKPIMDSTNIMKALDGLPSTKPLLYPLEPALKSEVVLLEDWADEVLIWYLLAYRWQDKDNYNRFKQEAFNKLPWLPRTLVPLMIRRTAVKRLKGQGIGLLTPMQRDANFTHLCLALDHKLIGRSYFVGSNLTAADIAIYAQLKQIIHTKLNPAYEIISGYTNLKAFMERLDQL